MADTRFFRRSGPFSLGSIAEHVGANLSHPALADRSMHDLAPLDVAGPNDISVFSDGAYQCAAASSRAGAMITNRKLGGLMPDRHLPALRRDPRLAFALVGALFYPGSTLDAGIHATALVDLASTIGKGCQIDAGAKIGRDVTIGRGMPYRSQCRHLRRRFDRPRTASSVQTARCATRSSVRASASGAIPASAARDLASCRRPTACCVRHSSGA